MFNFLKDKLKTAISKISKKVEEEVPQEEIEQEVKVKKTETKKEKTKPKVEKKKIEKQKKKEKVETKKEDVEEEHEHTIEEITPEEEDIQTIEKEIVPEELEEVKEEIIEEPKVEEKKGFFSKLKDKFTKKEEETKEEILTEEIKSIEEVKEEKKGVFGFIKEKITTTKISEEKFEELFYELELALLENNVAFEVVEKIKTDIKGEIVEKPIKRGEVEEEIKDSLKKSIESLFIDTNFNLLDKIKSKKPYVICFVGINGSGKTTTIAKMCHLLQKSKKSVVLAAGDTFRAAAIQQLKEWGSRLNVKVIAHDYGSDPAAVAFDAIKYAEAHGIDVVLIDTAGRLQSNKDLVREMQKIVRVAKPDLKLFIGESITGNDCVFQAQEFNNAINLDAIILSKADIDEKGGTMISVSYVTKKPILYLGLGQNPEDLKEFDKELIIKNLGF